MKKVALLLYILLISVLAACGPSNSESEATPDQSVEPALDRAPELDQPESEVEDDVVPRVTITPTRSTESGLTEAYPEIDQPTATPFPEGYPQPESGTGTVRNPYPADAGTVWVLKPAGIQCEDPTYASEEEAVASLEEADIQTFASQTVELMVTASCSSPTSTQYAAEIQASDAAAAEAEGWRVVSIDELEGN